MGAQYVLGSVLSSQILDMFVHGVFAVCGFLSISAHYCVPQLGTFIRAAGIRGTSEVTVLLFLIPTQEFDCLIPTQEFDGD